MTHPNDASWPMAAIDIRNCPADIAPDALILVVATWAARGHLIREESAVVHLAAVGDIPASSVGHVSTRFDEDLPPADLDAATAMSALAPLVQVGSVWCRDPAIVGRHLARIVEAAGAGRQMDVALAAATNWNASGPGATLADLVPSKSGHAGVLRSGSWTTL